MATNRKKRSRGLRPDYSAAIINHLLTGEDPTDEEGYWEILAFGSADGRTVDGAWNDLRDELLAGWIQEHPGSRPWAWWACDAPRWEKKFNAWFDGTLPEPRIQIGGTGVPVFVKYPAFVPILDYGLPGCCMEGVDPADPPTFESEAAYLDRHGLLSAAERKALPPDAFEPEAIK